MNPHNFVIATFIFIAVEVVNLAVNFPPIVRAGTQQEKRRYFARMGIVNVIAMVALIAYLLLSRQHSAT